MNKKIAMVLASRDFRDEEYFETRAILEKKGCKITPFSDKKGIAIGRFGGEVKINKDLNELDSSVFDVLLFVGGGGAVKYLDNETSYNLINLFNQEKKVIAAICIAPVILAKAGVLKGVKATVWNDKKAIQELENNGATFIDQKSVIHKNIVTANGPDAVSAFCKDILLTLKANCV